MKRTLAFVLSALLFAVAAGSLLSQYTPQPQSAAASQRAKKFTIQRTPARLARGKYLVHYVADCFGCHSQVDWKKTVMPIPGTEGGGGEIPDDTTTYKVHPPNISPDPETGAGNWTDDQFIRALRQGIGNDGRTLMPFMPYLAFRNMSDEDLYSIIVYIRSIPPVRHKVPLTAWPKQIADHWKPLPPPSAPIPPPDFSNPVKRGDYLVNALADCSGCHTPSNAVLEPLPGLNFSGGFMLHGPWGKVSSANLTPDPSGIIHYDEKMFLQTVRTGKVGGVRSLNNIMPWQHFRHMTDADLKAIFAYLRTLKPVQHRVDNTEPLSNCKLCRGSHGFGDRN